MIWLSSAMGGIGAPKVRRAISCGGCGDDDVATKVLHNDDDHDDR